MLSIIKGLDDSRVEEATEEFEAIRAKTEENDGKEEKYVLCQTELNEFYTLLVSQTGRDKLAVAGGVAANSRIRHDIVTMADKLGVSVYLPPLSLCGDNAAMIGAQAYYEYLANNLAGMELNAYATKSILGEAL